MEERIPVNVRDMMKMKIIVDSDYFKALGSSRNYVYSYLKQFPNHTRNQCLEGLQMSDRAFREALRDLEEWGYVKPLFTVNNRNLNKMIGVEILK